MVDTTTRLTKAELKALEDNLAILDSLSSDDSAAPAPTRSLSQNFKESSPKGEKSAAEFWADVPGFGQETAKYLNPNQKTDADELYKSDLIVKQAQEFLKFRFKNDIGGMSAETKYLLNKTSLTEDERQEIVAEAIEEAGWIGNNTISMGKVFAEIKSDSTSDAEKQATLFMMDISDNLSFGDNWGKKVWRFAYQGILTDPLTVGSIALGAVSFGSGTAAGLGAKEAAKLGMRKFIGEGLRRATGQTVKNSVARGAVQGAEIGVVDAAINNAAEQGIKTEAFTDNVQTEQKRQKEFSTGQVATSAALGGAAGAGFSFFGHSVAHYWNTSSAAKKIRSFFGMEEPAPKESHDFWGRPKETKSTTDEAAQPKQDEPDTTETTTETAEETPTPKTDEAGPASNNNAVETTAPGAAPINKAAEILTPDTSSASTHNAADILTPDSQLASKSAPSKPQQTTTKATDPGKAEPDAEETILAQASTKTKKHPARTYDSFSIDQIADKKMAKKASKQMSTIEDAINDPKNFMDILGLALAKPDDFQTKLDAFLAKNKIEKTELHSNIQEQLVSDGAIMLLAQKAAFTRQIDNAITAGQTQFNANKHLNQFTLLREREEFSATKMQEFKNFIEANAPLFTQMTQSFEQLKKKTQDNLSAEEKAFIKKYEHIIENEKSDLNPNKSTTEADGTPTLNTTAKEKKYNKLKESYLDIKRAKAGIDIPKLQEGTSWRMAGLYLLMQNPENISANDALRMAPKFLPVDARSNIQNIVSAVDATLSKNSIQKKIIDLHTEIGKLAKQADAGTDTPDNIREQIAERLAQFSQKNKKQLAEAVDNLSLIELEVSGWATRENAGIGLRQGISPTQKNDALKFIKDIKKIAVDLQKPDFGNQMKLKPGDSDTFLSKAQTTKEFEHCIDYIYGRAVSSYRTTTGKEPNGDKSYNQLVHSRERSIEGGGYTTSKSTDFSQKAEPYDPGNLEKLLDKTTISLANTAIRKKAWTVTESGDFAKVIATYIKRNMLQEGLYSLRELKWRLEAEGGDLYSTEWLQRLSSDGELDLKNNPYHKEAYSILAEAGSKDTSGGGGKPGWFGWKALGAGGKRWAEKQYIHLTWLYRLAFRMNSNNTIATPAFIEVQQALGRKALDVARYLGGGIKTTTREKNELDIEVDVDKWVWGTDKGNGIIGRIPVIKKVWNHQLGTPLRVATRLAFLPEAAAYYAMKTGYRQFGNTAIVLGTAGMAAGAIELAGAAATGSDAPVDFMAHTLNAGRTAAGFVADAVIAAEDYKMGLLAAAGLKEDAPIAKMLRLGDKPEMIWDFVDENAEFLIKNKIGNYGEYGYAASLQNSMINFDLNESYQEFHDYFITGIASEPALTIDQRIAQATDPLYRKFLSDLKSRASDIEKLKAQITTDIENAETAMNNAQRSLSEAQRIESNTRTNTEAESISYRNEVHEAHKTLADAKTAYNKATAKKDYLCKFLLTSVIADQSIQDHEEQLATIEEALNNKPTTVERRQLNREKEKIQEKIEKHLAYSTQAYAAVTGQNPELFARKQEAEQKQDNQDVEAASTSNNTPEEGAEAGGEKGKGTDGQATTSPPDLTTPFGTASDTAAEKAARARREAAQKKAAEEQQSRDEIARRAASPGKELTGEDAWNEVAGAVGPEVAGGIRSTFDSASTFVGGAFNALKNSNSPWVGGILAVFGAIIGYNTLTSGGKNISNFFGGLSKLLLVGLGGLGIWAGWRAWSGSNTASPTGSSAEGSSAHRYTPPKSIIVPTIGQSSNSDIFPANDPHYMGTSSTTQGHDGQGLRMTRSTTYQATLGTGNATPDSFTTSANNTGYRAADNTVIDRLDDQQKTSTLNMASGHTLETVSLQHTG